MDNISKKTTATKLTRLNVHDLGILRVFMREASVPWALSRARKPYRAVARELGMSEGTVWSRINRLEKSGVLAGWNAIVNPSLAGMSVSAVVFEVAASDSKSKLLDKIIETKEVLNLVNFVGNVVAVQVCHRDEESLEKIIERIARVGNTRMLYCFAYPFPSVNFKLSATDRNVVMLLARNPRLRLDSVARELGLSSRTVRRRLERIANGNAIFTGPAVDFSSGEGIIQADMIVVYEGRAERASIGPQIRSRLGEYLIREEVSLPHFSVFVTALTSISDFRQVSAWCKALRGIRFLHYGIIQESKPMFERFGEFLERGWGETSRPPQLAISN